MLWYVGRIDRKLVSRGIRILCARACHVDGFTLTRINHRTGPECEAFLGQVRRELARW